MIFPLCGKRGGFSIKTHMKFKITSSKDRDAVKEYIDRLPEGKVYNVDITARLSKRSNDQNRLYWLWLNCLAKELGYSPDEMHAVFAHKYLGADYETVCGETILIIPSTRKLDSAQFTTYLDKIKLFAANELGVVLPDPMDKVFEQFYDTYK